jgi:hypothetical protein
MDVVRAGRVPLVAPADLADDDVRMEYVARYAFGVPTEEALAAIAAVSPRGVVEIGAGSGYWAALLRDRGVRVEAYDIAPEPPPAAGAPARGGGRRGGRTTSTCVIQGAGCRRARPRPRGCIRT